MPLFDFELHNYEILDLLGEGGMAQTFLARRLGTWGEFSRLCVIKRPLQGAKDYDEGELELLFAAEVQLSASLQHPNICPAFDAGEDSEGVPYLAMEYIDGIDLKCLLRHYALLNEQLPIDVAAYIIAQVALALHYAHSLTVNGRPRRVVHRDVSPDNIIIDRHGHVWLLDFGAAMYAERGRFTKTHEARGKSLYMSPEHLGDIETMDGRSDLFSLGIVLYEMLTGTHPFEHRSKTSLEAMLMSIRDASYKEPRLLARNLPRALASLVQELLAPLRENRPPTGVKVAEVLADHFRTVTTGLELGSIVQTAIVTLARAADEPPSAQAVPQTEEDAVASSAVATIRPSAPTTVSHKRKAQSGSRRHRQARRQKAWLVGGSLSAVAAAALLGLYSWGRPHNEPRAPSSSVEAAAQQPRSTAPSERPTRAQPTPVSVPQPPPNQATTLEAHDQAPAAETSSAENPTASGAPSKASARPPLSGTLTVRIGGGCIFLDGVPRGERKAILRGLRMGSTHDIGFGSDCSGDIDEHHPVTVRLESDRVTYDYLPAKLPSF
jgi:serine/threonine protein kinase